MFNSDEKTVCHVDRDVTARLHVHHTTESLIYDVTQVQRSLTKKGSKPSLLQFIYQPGATGRPLTSL